jgi:CRISPR-associated endonuclease/helicase Cas3
LRDIARPGWAALPPADQLRILQKRWAIRDERDPKARRKLLDTLAPDEREWFEVSPLDVYALRGGMYRETAWTRSPLQPTVIASTVDQVGSRLLFRGYGVSDGMKPVHAGLVGNDALILLDEAHCAKPFDQTMQAVRGYRDWHPSPAPFHFVSITATPTGGVPEDQIERDNDADRNHSVLGKRIGASKPAKLVVATKATGRNWRKELVAELAKQARALAADAKCVGIIVNRVATARDLRDELRKTHADGVVLLTGRMRPLDRDRLFEERLKPLLSASTSGEQPPQFVIGTQALEVGADFDFHALVTECASLDALRQRFGRLNRVAKREQAPAVIVVRADQTEVSDKNADPVYGDSLANTWQWLQGKAKESVFDFGVAAVRTATKDEDLAPLNAPSSDAPVLFPVHLDCWVQTNPRPLPDPDPAPFLHGPKDPGEPDVQVVFRSDLGPDREKWAAVVALCPPSSSEAVPVPMGVFRKWLRGEPVRDESADVEGGPVEPETEEEEEYPPRFALRWAGPDRSEPVDGKPAEGKLNLRADGMYVIPIPPADRADEMAAIRQLADLPDVLSDYGDEAFQRSRDRAVLRFTPAVAAGWPSAFRTAGVTELFALADTEGDRDEFAARLDEVLDGLAQVDVTADELRPWAWLPRAAAALARPVENRSRPKATNREYEPYPEGLSGFVLTGRKRLFQFDPTYLDDTEPDESARGRDPVTLEDHSAGVAAFAKRFATGCGLPPDEVDVFTRSGLWHDLGKLDPRFQAMLQGRSPATTIPPPLAKSRRQPRTPEEKEAARATHRYPKGGRHELLSVELLGNRDDLSLHLIATHHGTARPFTDPVTENDAVRAPFATKLFGASFEADTAAQQSDRWNESLPNRFWRVVRQHGWWGAAYREAAFRLADHSQSRAEQEGNERPIELPSDVPPPPLAPTAAPVAHRLPLPGLDGANPLAFLATLGTLVLCERLSRSVDRPAWLNGPVALSWGAEGSIQTPVLHLHAAPPSEDDFAAGLATRLARSPEAHPAAWAVSVLREMMRDKEIDLSHELRERCRCRKAGEREYLDWVTALVCETAPEATSQLQTVRRDYMVGNLVSVMARAEAGHLARCLFRPWDYADALDNQSLHWEPSEDRRHAYQWHQPNGDPTRKRQGGMLGANRLALEAWPLFPAFPASDRVQTRGFSGVRANDTTWTWPLWAAPLTTDAIGSLLGLQPLQEDVPDAAELAGYGVRAVFRSQRILIGKTPNLTAATALG